MCSCVGVFDIKRPAVPQNFVDAEACKVRHPREKEACPMHGQRSLDFFVVFYPPGAAGFPPQFSRSAANTIPPPPRPREIGPLSILLARQAFSPSPRSLPVTQTCQPGQSIFPGEGFTQVCTHQKRRSPDVRELSIANLLGKGRWGCIHLIANQRISSNQFAN